MSDNAVPSLDPADTGTMSGLLRQTFRKLMQSTDGMLPATVIAVSADRSFVTVQPLIMVLATDKSTTPRAQIAKVPAMAMGAGNFVFSFPMKAGDLGWIFASDRDISLYVQSNAQAAPNTNRLHSFEDGMFIPDKARQWALADEDADNAVWQSLDGAEKITLGAAKVKILHPTLVEFDGPHVTVPQGDLAVHLGIGFFGVTPPGAQPQITGALSSVSDAAVKAVLTSIIAVMVGNGEASDHTT